MLDNAKQPSPITRSDAILSKLYSLPSKSRNAGIAGLSRQRNIIRLRVDTWMSGVEILA